MNADTDVPVADTTDGNGDEHERGAAKAGMRADTDELMDEGDEDPGQKEADKRNRWTRGVP